MDKYDNILFIEDFNSETSENYCYKNPDNPSCIDLFLTNRWRCFQNTVAADTGISDLVLPQNGSYGIESFLQETKTKNHSLEKVRQFEQRFVSRVTE